jgi:hypothetical protein
MRCETLGEWKKAIVMPMYRKGGKQGWKIIAYLINFVTIYS